MPLVKVANLVLGSGFSAAQLQKDLQKLGKQVLVLDASSAFTPVSVASNFEEYNSSTLTANARPGGGSWTWGGKVTLPTDTNWFGPHPQNNPSWSHFGKFAIQETSRGTDYFSKFLPKNWASRPQLTNLGLRQFQISRHRHLTSKLRLNRHVRRLGKHCIKAVSGIKIQRRESFFEITFSDESRSIRTIRCENLFLASGPIGNAIALSLITGHRDFPIGNHAGGVVATAMIRKWTSLRRIAALVPWGEFVSWSRKRTVNALNHSFRLVPAQTLNQRLHSLGQSMRSGEFGKIVRTSIDLFRDYVLQSPRVVGVQAMADTGLHAILRITWSQGNDGEFQLPSATILAANQSYRDQVVSELIEFVDEISNWADLEIIEPMPALTDSHHYFGTCPMSDSPIGDVFVNSQFQVNGWPGLFCVGASSFPVGSHGHPTWLATLTSQFAVGSLQGFKRS